MSGFSQANNRFFMASSWLDTFKKHDSKDTQGCELLRVQDVAVVDVHTEAQPDKVFASPEERETDARKLIAWPR